MPYVDKTEVKKYTGVNFTSGLDSFIDTVILACQNYVEKYCGDEKFGKRKFQAPTPDNLETRYFDGSGATKLYVGDLFEIESLFIGDEEYIEDEDFVLYPLNAEESYQYIELIQPYTSFSDRNSRLGFTNPYIFEKGQANVEIEGKWYHTDEVPAEIKLAVLKLVGGVIKENISDNDVKEKKSESLGDYSVSFQDVDKIAHKLKVSDLLNQYKRKSGLTSSGVILAE